MQVSRSSTPGSNHWNEADARQVLAELAASGLSQAEFCRGRGIRSGRLSFWRARLAGKDRGAFVPVVVREEEATGEATQLEASAGAVEVVLGNGWVIRVHEGCARSNVEKVLAAARGVERREAGRC